MINKKLFWIFGLSASIYFTQGISGLPGQALFYYLKESLHYTPSTIMYISALTGIAWLIKPIWGYLIDLLHWKQKTWINIALFINASAAFILGISYLPIGTIITLLILDSTCAAFRDTACDGIMVKEGKKHKETGRIQSVQWIAMSIASIFVGITGGYVAEKFDYKIGYLCLIPIFIIIGLVVNQYKEKIPKKKNITPKQVFKLLKNKQYVLGGVLFMFLYCFSPSFGTPLLYIQRDSFGWSKIFIGGLGTVVAIVQIIAALLYFKFSKKINIQKWLVASVFIGAIVTCCYLFYTPTTAILYSVLFCVIGMFVHLCLMDYTARICPKGLETVGFACLCSVYNLSGTLSNITGAWLLPKVGLKPLIVIAALTSFLCLPLIKYLKLKKVKVENVKV